MSRTLCLQCNRPEKACICAFAVQIDNKIHLVVLQHPSEVKQSKGTVALLQQSLAHCEVLVGELFDNSKRLDNLLAFYGEGIALLYPSEKATEIIFPTSPMSDDNKSDALTSAIKCMIILDGTWKKSYRMFMLNPRLDHIKHLVLPEGIESLYNIRKTKKDNALSSLEACCHALSRLENSEDKYQPLLNSFVKFNLFQQSFNQQNYDLRERT